MTRRYVVVYFFGWRVKNGDTGRLSERTLSYERAAEIVFYLNTR